jgi:hypothetical protein
VTTILVIPDTQSKPGVPNDHFKWIGKYIADKRPDVVVHLGDHWDMPSLSSYDKGKLAMEGRRYAEDIARGRADLAALKVPVKRSRSRRVLVEPKWILLRGNHEARITRAVEDNPHLEGTISLSDIDAPGWEMYDFLEVVNVNGVLFSHYFANPMTGRPIGGQAITRLKTLGHSFVQGHQQVLEFATRYVAGRKQTGIVAGACYLHDETYMGPQGNHHWRGVLMLHEVREGSFDMMEVSLDYLCRRYEGMGVGEFLRANYPEQRGTLWRAP